MKYIHYSTMGASMAPTCADSEGFLAIREGFELFPPSAWTEAEEWVSYQEEMISAWRLGE